MTGEQEVPQWSTEAVAESFRAELRARFEAHNAAHRIRDAAELEEVLRKNPERRGTPGFEVRDSFAWDVYQACEIRIERNSVTIVMPAGYGFRTDLLPLFDHTTVAWSRPFIGATIVDGEARPTIEITLVATWTDEMDEKWRREGHTRRQVVVDLFEEEVLALDALVAAQPATEASESLRNRLKLSLEYIP